MQSKKHQEEFTTMIKGFKLSMEKYKISEEYHETNRKNIILKGVDEAVNNSSIMNAAALVFDEFRVIRISARLMYKRVLNYMNNHK